jgi:polyketide biosynthesis 3-hydroxy-3-methylglutaryl-CoA synthase-like enzyme PksG
MVGIEAMNAYLGMACVDSAELARHRELEVKRFENLMMREKSVALHSEDPVSFAVNAAKPIVDALAPAERQRIELLITCTESGLDFGKSISTYVHAYLGLDKRCRMFELKQACYSGTAGFQTAVNFILSQQSPGAKALVIAVDICRFLLDATGDPKAQDWSFAEPSGGAGAVAMLISERPHVFRLDIGASGYHGYEVMDTCRPAPESEAGDADLSLMSYLDCCEQTFRNYRERVAGADYRQTFQHLVFHTPFGGMVKGAHRSMMRKFAPLPPEEIDRDFQRRVAGSLSYCQRVGNIMGGTLFLALAGAIARGSFETPKRIGCFSYGSGCCSEFFSGTVTAEAQQRLAIKELEAQLDRRYRLSMQEYDSLLVADRAVRFGTRNADVDCAVTDEIRRRTPARPPTLFLTSVRDFHRKYELV